MKTKLFITFFIFNTSILFSQIPADSLVGIYCGEKWKADPAGSPWVITIDTIRVYYIDSTICQAKWWAATNSSQNFTYCTDYFSCYNANPQSPYMKFYNVDSVRIINDYYPQPYPNPPTAHRLYGKRIPGSNGTVGITETPGEGRINIFPNPGKGMVTIDYPENFTSYELFDIHGNRLICNSIDPQLSTHKFDFSFLPSGMYMIRFLGDKTSKTGKIVIQ